MWLKNRFFKQSILFIFFSIFGNFFILIANSENVDNEKDFYNVKSFKICSKKCIPL